jgi:predicted nucleic acid-binding protein
LRYLLDTNVLSETRRPRPDSAVIAFLETTDEDSLFLSVITLAELRRGVDRLPSGRRRSALNEWLENDLIARFDGRILGIERETADAWGRLMARAERNGRTPAVLDVWIAAIAVVHGMTVVTRDVADFTPLSDQVFNPWSDA